MEVLTYLCPNCGAPLAFNSETQKWDCKFCLTSYDKASLDAIQKQEAEKSGPEPAGQQAGKAAERPNQTETSEDTRGYLCPNCGAEIITDGTTAATFCTFCGNPTVLPQRLSGQFSPDILIPFKLKKEDAVAALEQLCRKKPLLPRDFRSQSHIEKVTGIYVPFWLFDCDCFADLSAKAERIATWSDSKYRYTKTDIFHVQRSADFSFSKIPADGSSKMQNEMMDALEPFDYQELQQFHLAYLSGYFAEKYDEDQNKVFPRIEERLDKTTRTMLLNTIDSYAAVQPTRFTDEIQKQKEALALFPVWLLHTKYRDTSYLFAMNGQTGKMVGKLPVSYPRASAIFAAVSLVTAAFIFLGGMLF